MFGTVVVLKQQMRSTDPRWNDILANARIGECTEEDLEELCLLVLDDRVKSGVHGSRQDLREEDDWREAVLVTPCHTVRTEWNEAALNEHCRSSGNIKFTSKAIDTINSRALTGEERIRTVMKTVHDKQKTTRKEGLNSASSVDMAVGMKVMILTNINPTIDIANGSRGIITKIVLDEAETVGDDAITHVLSKPPLYVVV